MQKFFFSLLVVTLALLSCNKTETGYNTSPVVECYVIPGDTVVFHVTKQIAFGSDSITDGEGITGLAISFFKNNESYSLTDQGDGIYSLSSATFEPGDELTFSFTYGSEEVSGYTYIPSTPLDFECSVSSMAIERMDTASGPPSGTMPDPAELTWTNSDNSNYLVVVENLEETLDPIRDFGDEEPPGNFFRKSPTTSSSERLSPMDFQYYGEHRIILFHVLPDYAALYDQNSTTSINLTNPSTSINYGFGIFSGLHSDTLYITITED